MNKKGFIKKVAKELGINTKDANIINGILDKNFLVGKNNKEKIVTELADKLNIDKENADKIYNKVASIIVDEIKNKLKNPFKNQD